MGEFEELDRDNNRDRNRKTSASSEIPESLASTDRAKKYRRLALSAQREAEQSSEPNRSYCLQISLLLERLAADLEARGSAGVGE